MLLRRSGYVLLILTVFSILSTVQLNAQCTVDAGQNVTICAGESVQIGGSPTIVAVGNNPEVSWNNGANNVANPVVSPASTTTYTVTLVDDDGCQTTDQVTVVVNPLPTAGFSFNPAGACSSNPVQFTNSSSGTGLEYQWSFGNPQSGQSNTSTANNPSHVFVAPGNGNQSFTVTLTVTTSSGCSATATADVPVLQSPNTSLTDADIFTPFVMCGNAAQTQFDITVNNTSTTQATNTNYTINWGDGTPVVSSDDFTSLSHTYIGSGFFDLTYTVTGANGCVSTQVYSVFAGSNPSVGLASPGSTINLCAPSTLVFPITNWQNNSDGTIYTVTFSDGTPAQTFIHPPPESISHVFNTSSCGNSSVGGFANSFHVTILAENPCGFSAATIEPIQTSSAPSAAMSVTPGEIGCAGAPFTFTNSSTNANFISGGNCVNLMQAQWSIDPPTGWSVTGGSLNDPTSFNAAFEPGNYTITMVGTNPCGSDEISLDICVTTPPVANFTATPLQGCAPLLVPTNNQSSSMSNCDDETYLWQVIPATGWNYASGNATAQSPTFNFTQAGTYTLQLTVTNACGTSVQTETVTVFQLPTALVAPIADGCEGISFIPSGTFTNGGTPITSYQWSFPGGSPNTSNVQNPGQVSYTQAGSYTLSVTVTNLCGSVTANQSFTIESAPNVQVVPVDPEVCAGQSVALTASGAVTYSWSPTGGLNPITGANVTSTPSQSTTYTVTGTSQAGCTSTATTSVTVNPLPSLTPGGPYAVCAGECVDVGVTPSGGTPPYQNYSWSPANGLNQTNAATVTACPTTTQNYQVTVADANGCQATATVNVNVNPLPIVNAGPDLTLCNQPVPEQITGFTPVGGTWSGTNVTADGVFTPSQIGSFTLTYSFTNANDCQNSDTMEIEVIDPTAVDAGSDVAFCSGLGPQTLTPPTPGGVWSGDGVSAQGIFTPTTPGVYTLTYAVGGGSCLTEDQISVEVYPLPQPNAGADLNICAGEDTQLNGSVSGGTLPYSSAAWISAPGMGDNSVLDPIVSPAASTTYTLFVTDANGCEQGDDVVVEVLPAPIVNAGADLTLCNQPISEQLTGFTPVGGTWSGNGVTADGVFTPPAEGSYTLTYTYSNIAGCTAEDQLVVTVVDPETASAGDDFGLCLNTASVSLQAGGVWSGSNVTAQGVFTPSEVGTFILTMSIGIGTCETSDQVEVSVYPLPLVNLGDDLSTCLGGSVELSAVASSQNGLIVDYEWSGTGVETATTATVDVSPPASGLYSVTVTDELGCESSSSTNIEVLPLPVVSAGENITLCDQPIAEQLEGFSPAVVTPGGTGAWSGTGIVDAAGIFESPGVGTYTLTYTYTDNGGCIESDAITVTVVAPEIADAGQSESICLNNGAYVLTGFSPANNVTWSGIGVTDAGGVFDPLVSGTGDFVLTLEFGSGTCYTTDEMVVTVLGLPQMTVTPDPVFCGNAGVSSLGDFSPAGGWWEGAGIADDQNGTFDPSMGDGSYTVFYLYEDQATGCSDTLSVNVAVSPVPVAQFTAEPQSCTNAVMTLQNQSSGAASYVWGFGNGDESVQAAPQYTYPDEGDFTITLTATNAFGCVDTVTDETEVVHPPQAQIGISAVEGCAPLEVSFANQSEGQYLSFSWDLDVATSEDETPPVVNYQQGDDNVVYTVVLTATNYCGTSTTEETVTVFPQPVASFGTDYDAFCSPWPIQVNNTSVGNPDTFLWNFGNGQSSVLEQPGGTTYFTDEEPTEYTITLSLANECGTDDFSYTVTVLPNTVMAFFNTNLTSGCQPLTVEFTDFSTGGNVVSYDFGDGNVSNLLNPTHTFTQPGEFTIAQFVNNGCSFDTTYAMVEVFASPLPAFTAEVAGACAGDPVQFTNLTQGVNNVAWNFGDGITSNVTNPVHTFSSGGTYNVSIEVTTAGFQCPGTLTQPFTVYAVPNTSFAVQDQVGCSPFSVTFNNTTTGGNFYEWDFGNGEIGNTANVMQTFTNDTGLPVVYTVSLTASNLQLCSSEYSFDIIVSPSPVAAFDMSENMGCTFPVSLQLLNNSQFANGYNWDFGALGNSTSLNPVISLDAPGNYPITLTASNSFGCVDQTSEVFTINPLPEISFTTDVVSGCSPLTVNFTNTSVGGATYTWAVGGFTSTAQNPTFTLTAAGLYDVALLVTTSEGCSDTLMVDHALAVYALPQVAFTHTPTWTTTIYNPTFAFTDASIGVVDHYWSFGDGGASQAQNPTYSYNTPGTYTVTLIGESGFSCFGQATAVVTVRDQFNVYVPTAFTPDNDGVNDVFKAVIVGKDMLESYQLTIFDRWGMAIFSTEDPDDVWLGDFRGGDHYVQNDAYVWQIKYKLKGVDSGEVMTGHVMLLR